MTIEYGNSKKVKCYRDFVQDPDDRKASRAFSKAFGATLMESAKKLHDRLKQYTSAGAYNAIFGSTKNRIETKHGCADKEPLILKVRIDRGQRMFFNHIIDDAGNLLLNQDWHGNFDTITTIYVTNITNHDYNI